MRSFAFAIATLPLFATATAFAQEAPPPPRQGLELAIGLQGGKIYCEAENNFCNGFTEAGGANLNASYFFRPTLGLTADFWAMSHRENDFTFTHYVNTVGVKWRPAPILTLTLGLGAAHATLDYRGLIIAGRATSENAPAIMGAASIDVLRSRRWALSVEGRFGNGFYGEDADNDGQADIVGRNVGLGATFTLFGF
jgi:hypothetical protein